MGDEDESVFAAAPAPDMVWMRAKGTGPAQFPRAAAPLWQARGWMPCDAPQEVDPALVEHQPPPRPTSPHPPATSAVTTTKRSAVTTTKSTRS